MMSNYGNVAKVLFWLCILVCPLCAYAMWIQIRGVEINIAREY